VDNKQPTVGEIIIMAAGALMLIASFLDFGGDSNSWDQGAFPVATLIAIYGILMGAQVALTTFGNVRMSGRVGSFSWPQVHLMLAVFALVMSFGWMISGLADKGIGLWLLFVASIALVVGALMLPRERTPGTFR
jgi:hypothetical protein